MRLCLQDIHGLARGDVELGVTRTSPCEVGHAVRHLHCSDVLALTVKYPEATWPGDEDPAMFVDSHTIRGPAIYRVFQTAENYAT